MDKIDRDELILEVAGGGDIVLAVVLHLVPEGADENQRAGVDVDRMARLPTQDVQRVKPDALILHVAAGQLPEKALHAHRLRKIGERKIGRGISESSL